MDTPNTPAFAKHMPDRNQKNFWVAIRNDQPDLALAALALGADPNLGEPSDGGALPIHRASAHHTSRCLDILFAAGVPHGSVHALDREGCPPLFYASLDVMRNTPEYSKAHAPNLAGLPIFTLLALGADPCAQDEDGDTPLHQAASCGFMVAAQALLGAGADPRVANHRGDLPADLARERHAPELAELFDAMAEALYLKQSIPAPAPASPTPPRL